MDHPAPMSAMDRALAKIDADCARFAAIDRRKAEDSRLTYLKTELERMDPPITGSGYDGFAQMMGKAMGPGRNRRSRLRRLIDARGAQIAGFSARKRLEEAASYRRAHYADCIVGGRA